MRLTRFNTFFPLLFILVEFIIVYLVTKLMHYLTFAEWTIYNSLIIAFWIILSRFFWVSSTGTPRRPSFPPRATIRKLGEDFNSQSILETPPLVVAPLIPALITSKVVLWSCASFWLSFSSRRVGYAWCSETPYPSVRESPRMMIRKTFFWISLFGVFDTEFCSGSDEQPANKSVRSRNFIRRWKVATGREFVIFMITLKNVRMNLPMPRTMISNWWVFYWNSFMSIPCA